MFKDLIDRSSTIERTFDYRLSNIDYLWCTNDVVVQLESTSVFREVIRLGTAIDLFPMSGKFSLPVKCNARPSKRRVVKHDQLNIHTFVFDQTCI